MSMTSVENLKIHKTGVVVSHVPGEKKGTSTLEFSMVAELLMKVIPIRVKATDKNSRVSCIQ